MANEYTIEAIIDSRTNLLGEEEVLIKWEGYDDSENTWEPRNGLNIGGAEENEDKENYITPLKAIRYTKTLIRARRHEGTFNIVQLGKELEPETIHFCLINNHFYVIIRAGGETYIADGANACLNKRNRKQIEIATGTKLKPIKYGHQIGIDHCGSSAILIATEMARRKNNNEDLEKTINATTGTRNNLIKRLHPHPSRKLNQRQSIKELKNNFTCELCQYKAKNLAGLKSHQRLKHK